MLLKFTFSLFLALVAISGAEKTYKYTVETDFEVYKNHKQTFMSQITANVSVQYTEPHKYLMNYLDAILIADYKGEKLNNTIGPCLPFYALYNEQFSAKQVQITPLSSCPYVTYPMMAGLWEIDLSKLQSQEDKNTAWTFTTQERNEVGRCLIEWTVEPTYAGYVVEKVFDWYNRCDRTRMSQEHLVFFRNYTYVYHFSKPEFTWDSLLSFDAKHFFVRMKDHNDFVLMDFNVELVGVDETPISSEFTETKAVPRTIIRDYFNSLVRQSYLDRRTTPKVQPFFAEYVKKKNLIPTIED